MDSSFLDHKRIEALHEKCRFRHSTDDPTERTDSDLHKSRVWEHRDEIEELVREFPSVVSLEFLVELAQTGILRARELHGAQVADDVLIVDKLGNAIGYRILEHLDSDGEWQ